MRKWVPQTGHRTLVVGRAALMKGMGVSDDQVGTDVRTAFQPRNPGRALGSSRIVPVSSFPCFLKQLKKYQLTQILGGKDN